MNTVPFLLQESQVCWEDKLGAMRNGSG